MLIPPAVDPRLLTKDFLEINHEADRNLVKMIGLLPFVFFANKFQEYLKLAKPRFIENTHCQVYQPTMHPYVQTHQLLYCQKLHN
jgi:hypothetical protein